MKTPEGVVKMGETEVLPNARLPDLGRVLGGKGYQVRGRGKRSIRKGQMAGKISGYSFWFQY